MRPSGGRQRPSHSKHSLQWSRGAQILCCVAALLLFVSQVSPARQQLQKRRRLGEDTALSAALDGLPVSPSAGSGMAGVNIYGLDNSLLAALQGNSSNSTNPSSSSSQGPAGAPAPQHAKTAPVVPAQHISSQSLNHSSSSIGPAMAPQAMANPPRSNVTPLDPLLAAALENQGRVSAPTVATRAPYGSSAPAVAPASIPSPAASAGYQPSGPNAAQQSNVACDNPAWQAASLKLLHERPFASLFLDSIDQTVFDPTGLEHINNIYYVVFNSTQGIAYVPNRMAPLDSSNKLIGISNNTERTTWGGIAYRNDEGAFLAVQERRGASNTSKYAALTGERRPVIQELNVAGDLKNYTMTRRCHVAFNLSEKVTGFQDIQFHTNSSGAKFVLGLCDGNHCESGEAGRDRGNGRIVVALFKEHSPPFNHCHWVPEKVISIPATAAFTSYAGLATRGNQLLISSKSDSQVWIGNFNWETWEFVDEGRLYNLPRSDACQVTYCNIGAVQWLDDRRITMASGVAQPGDPWPCFTKAESLHQFLLPASAARPVSQSS